MSDSPPSPNAPRPMSPTLAPAEETTPLVESTTAPSSSHERTPLLATTVQPSSEASPATPNRSKAIYVLTFLSLISSVATLVLIAVAFLTAQVMFTEYTLSWVVQGSLNTAIATGVIATITSSFNYSRLRLDRSTAPLAINLILDLVISIYAIFLCTTGLKVILDGYGFSCYEWPGDHGNCHKSALPVQVLLGLGLSMATVFGFIHLFLFAIRCRVAIRSISSSSYSRPWHLPSGQFTVEFTIKLLREAQSEANR